MNLIDLTWSPLQFYSTANYECSYLPHRSARSQVATPSQAINPDSYGHLIRDGFRRSGHFVYRPYCDGCTQCLSLRVLVDQFTPNRSQQRAWKRHNRLRMEVTPPYFNSEHYKLYLDYQHTQHAGSSMSQDSVVQYTEFLLTSRVNTQLVEFRDAQTKALKIVSLIDMLDDGLSAVYTFFDTNDTASYGTYAILWQIEQAKKLKLPFVYLGYWIEGTPKMRYKDNFQPNQKLIHGAWCS